MYKAQMTISTPIFLPFHRIMNAWEIWEPGHYYYWGSFTYHSARYKGAYSLFWLIQYFVFLADGTFICTPLLNRAEKSNVFKGWLVLWGWQCILVPQELALKFALVFNPVSQLFVFHEFHVCSSSMSMLEINKILELLIPNFVMMVLFLLQCLSLAIFWSLWICNIASVFLFGFIIDDLFSYIYLAVAIFYDVMKFEFNLFL